MDRAKGRLRRERRSRGALPMNQPRPWTRDSRRADRAAGSLRLRLLLLLPLMLCGCSEQLDAGATRPHGLLPVDERNPVILTNDGAFDNWAGEYAVLLANGGGSPLAEIIVSASFGW